MGVSCRSASCDGDAATLMNRSEIWIQEPIDGLCPFQGHPGSWLGHDMEKPSIQFSRFFAETSIDDVDFGLAEVFDSLTSHFWIGINRGHHHFSNSSLDQQVGTRRSFAVMAARFKGDVCGTICQV